MEKFILITVFLLLFNLLFLVMYEKVSFNKKKLYALKHFVFPEVVVEKFKKDNPFLNNGEVALIFSSLGEYFAACYMHLNSTLKYCNAGGLGMPSKIVDEAWHTFLLFSKEYEIFNKTYFNGMLIHTPDDVSKSEIPQGIKKNVLNLFEAFEEMRKRGYMHYNALPNIFFMDKELSISNGFIYNQSDVELIIGKPNKSADNSKSGNDSSGCSAGVGGSSKNSHDIDGGSSCSSCGAD